MSSQEPWQSTVTDMTDWVASHVYILWEPFANGISCEIMLDASFVHSHKHRAYMKRPQEYAKA